MGEVRNKSPHHLFWGLKTAQLLKGHLKSAISVLRNGASAHLSKASVNAVKDTGRYGEKVLGPNPTSVDS